METDLKEQVAAAGNNQQKQVEEVKEEYKEELARKVKKAEFKMPLVQI